MFCHECQRVFHDRLVDKTDKKYFYGILSEMSSKYFSKDVSADKFEESPIIFGDFLKIGASGSDRIYEEFTNTKKLISVLEEYLDDFNLNSSKEMKLVFFMDAIQHVSRYVYTSCVYYISSCYCTVYLYTTYLAVTVLYTCILHI